MVRLLSRKLSVSDVVGGTFFTLWGKTARVRLTKRSNNVLVWTDLVRCHPRKQSQASKGGGPSVLRTTFAADGLWSVLWSLSVFLLPLVSVSTINTNATPPPGDFHTRSNAITPFDMFRFRITSSRGQFRIIINVLGNCIHHSKISRTTTKTHKFLYARENKNRSDSSLCLLAASSRGLVLSLMFQ